jgi:hypothetical protein
MYRSAKPRMGEQNSYGATRHSRPVDGSGLSLPTSERRIRCRRWPADECTPEVPFCAVAWRAAAVVLARRSAPDRVPSAAPAAPAAERGSACFAGGVGGLRVRSCCRARTGTCGGTIMRPRLTPGRNRELSLRVPFSFRARYKSVLARRGATGVVWVVRELPNDTGESGLGDVGADEDGVGEVGDDSITSHRSCLRP